MYLSAHKNRRATSKREINEIFYLNYGSGAYFLTAGALCRGTHGLDIPRSWFWSAPSQIVHTYSFSELTSVWYNKDFVLSPIPNGDMALGQDHNIHGG